MRLPRDVSGVDLIKALRAFGYEVTRQTGSHIRVTTGENGVHNLTIPNHNPIKIGTLAGILDEVAAHFEIERRDLLDRLKI